MYNGEGEAALPPLGQWTTGLYDCSDDTWNCCWTLMFTRSSFSQNVEIIDQGRTSRTCSSLICSALCCFGGLHWLYTYKFRSKLRALYNLPEEPCSDCCVHFCCFPCAICQEYRELKNRGLDPLEGWKAHEERLRKANVAPPRVEPAMTR